MDLCTGRWAHSNLTYHHILLSIFLSCFPKGQGGVGSLGLLQSLVPMCVRKHLSTWDMQRAHQAPYSCYTSWNSLFNPMLIHWLIHWLIQIQLQANRTTAPPTHAHTCSACHQYYHFNWQCSKSGESAPAAAVGLWIDHPPAEPRTSMSETPSVLTQSSVLSLMNPYFHHPSSLLWACGEFL